MDQHAEFRTRLRSALAGRGMTQSELARRLGVRDATVSDWFNRGTMPGGAVMLRLPDLLGVDGHWLLTGRHRRLPRLAPAIVADTGADAPADVAALAIQHLETVIDLLRRAGGDGRAAEARPREAASVKVRGRRG